MVKSHNPIRVAVGLLIRGEQVLVTKRAAHQHQGNLWEFPGGKCEADETPLQALQREFQEEVNVRVEAAEPALTIDHTYPDKAVTLLVFRITHYAGEPTPQEGQPMRWQDISALDQLEFPEANLHILNYFA